MRSIRTPEDNDLWRTLKSMQECSFFVSDVKAEIPANNRKPASKKLLVHILFDLLCNFLVIGTVSDSVVDDVFGFVFGLRIHFGVFHFYVPFLLSLIDHQSYKNFKLSSYQYISYASHYITNSSRLLFPHPLQRTRTPPSSVRPPTLQPSRNLPPHQLRCLRPLLSFPGFHCRQRPKWLLGTGKGSRHTHHDEWGERKSLELQKKSNSWQ